MAFLPNRGSLTGGPSTTRLPVPTDFTRSSTKNWGEVRTVQQEDHESSAESVILGFTDPTSLRV